MNVDNPVVVVSSGRENEPTMYDAHTCLCRWMHVSSFGCMRVCVPWVRTKVCALCTVTNEGKHVAYSVMWRAQQSPIDRTVEDDVQCAFYDVRLEGWIARTDRLNRLVICRLRFVKIRLYLVWKIDQKTLIQQFRLRCRRETFVSVSVHSLKITQWHGSWMTISIDSQSRSHKQRRLINSWLFIIWRYVFHIPHSMSGVNSPSSHHVLVLCVTHRSAINFNLHISLFTYLHTTAARLVFDVTAASGSASPCHYTICFVSIRFGSDWVRMTIACKWADMCNNWYS